MEKVTMHNLTISENLSSKIELIESTLHQTIYNFRDLVTEVEQMFMTTESVKKQVIAQREKCESKCCEGSEELKKVIQSKENIIQDVALALTKLSNTKDFSIITNVFGILFGDSSSTLDDKVKEENNKDEMKPDINIEAMTLLSPKKEPENMSIEEQNISECEIAGTPTGRLSPIIQTKKLKSSTSNTPSRDKKKCPQNWMTPEKKHTKVTLTFPLASPSKSKGSGRLRQQRIKFVREKITSSVDLTTMPQFSKGRNSQPEECLSNIKQEMIENDDTIMPSPTSGPVFAHLYKPLSKESPQKFKKPLSLIRSKAERREEKTPATNSKENVPLPDDTNVPELEESVDLLKVYRNGFVSPKKSKTRDKSPVEANDSISLLQQFNVMETETAHKSPVKTPLAENVNVGNVPCDTDSSMSILRKDLKLKTSPVDDNIKRTKCQIEPLYKEPTVRKKAEKRALPGWSCDECKNFYGELYKDDLEMQAKKMDECSKHRGRNNPVRPKTPPGYWDPRWDVPQDTEEFNRRNNAV